LRTFGDLRIGDPDRQSAPKRAFGEVVRKYHLPQKTTFQRFNARRGVPFSIIR
jgi:hypothetical protein